MTPPRLDEFVAPGSAAWGVFACVALLGRGADLFSTWLATPRLELEANPIARRLGWRWGVPFNATMALAAGLWPMLAVSLATTSCLVAARNLQQAWLMRSMGETGYRFWFAERIAAAPPRVVWACFLGESVLTGAVGAALMAFGPPLLVPFAVGLGVLGYGVAVALFTGISLWRFLR